MDSLNLFDLFAKITLDTSEYEEGVDQAKKKSSTFFDVLKANLASQVIVGGVKLLGSAIEKVGVAALNSYANYEQLTGGVETLFKESSGTVMKYAENAYKTAGLSANQYMETVTSFSASLLQSLDGDTEKAASVADTAITDMADNANKMGTSIESIQNAYQGFAKQNYAMLDNLKLGYGGTKEEMQRLIDDANAVKVANGEMADLTIDSFADVTEAIHIVQTEMGITGTTAKEASSTISGSVSAMKSAWTNLVTGLGDANADIGLLLDNFLDSVKTVGGNLVPVIKTIGGNMLEAIEERGPDMVAEGAVLLAQLAVGLIKGIPGLISKIPKIVLDIVNAFKERGPEFEQIGANILEGIWGGISEKIAWLKGKVVGVVDTIKGWFTGKDGFDTHSPSKWSEKVFGYVMDGGGVGLERNLPSLMRHVDGVVSHVKEGMDFGSAQIGYEYSAAGMMGASIGERFSDKFGPIGEGATFVLDVMLDGATVAHKTYKYTKREENLRGGSLVEVGA